MLESELAIFRSACWIPQCGRFQHVCMLSSNARGDYLLRGQLYDFREVDGKLLVARVAFVFELRDTKTGATCGPTSMCMMRL